jgi:hypothetical protein
MVAFFGGYLRGFYSYPGLEPENNGYINVEYLKDIFLKWVSAHLEVPGNVKADKLVEPSSNSTYPLVPDTLQCATCAHTQVKLSPLREGK